MSANSGVQRVPVKNSGTTTDRKNSIGGNDQAMTMPTVVATDTRAAATSRTSMTRSP